MKLNRVTALLLSLTLAFSLAACGQGASSASTASSAASSAAAESKTEEQLLAEENEILSANDALWEKVFASMDKNMTETTLSTNYGDFLRSSVEKTKDQFSDEEYKTLTADAEKIRAIEEQIATLALADAAASGAAAQGTAFPQFEGSDLEGNPVDNSLFAGNAFTVVNFWFNGCSPCVGELPALQKLHDSLQEKGGAVVGINVETLDENEDTIAAAKEIMKKQGASYQNIYFDSDSEAGKLALSVMTFPTSVLIDSEGNISDEARQNTMNDLKAHFRPEFLNRLDDIINFDQLDLEAIKRIVDIELKPIVKRVKEMGYTLETEEDAKEFLARKGYDVQYGARPLKRALQTYLEDAICELVINDELQEGEILTVRAAEGDKLRITHGLAQE